MAQASRLWFSGQSFMGLRLTHRDKTAPSFSREVLFRRAERYAFPRRTVGTSAWVIFEATTPARHTTTCYQELVICVGHATERHGGARQSWMSPSWPQIQKIPAPDSSAGIYVAELCYAAVAFLRRRRKAIRPMPTRPSGAAAGTGTTLGSGSKSQVVASAALKLNER